jgi:hypothetical protein
MSVSSLSKRGHSVKPPDNPHYPYPEWFWEKVKDGPVTTEETLFMALLRARRGSASASDYSMLLRLLKKGTPTWKEVQRLKREKPPTEDDAEADDYEAGLEFPTVMTAQELAGKG